MFEQIKGILAASSMLRRLVMVNGFVLLLVVTLGAMDRLLSRMNDALHDPA